ncbi:MAG: hypothetical protein PHD95_00725 [Candidatus ainarchaeum sp.]|nr:hypothetical protein [Candidatus ainarchaeum sp.]
MISLAIFVVLTTLIVAASHVFGLHRTYNLPERDILFLNVQIAVAISSSVLVIILLAQYLESFLKFRTNFTLGFVIMALVLLAHSITSNPLFFSYFGYSPMEGPFSIIPNIFTIIAVFALLYLNMQ